MIDSKNTYLFFLKCNAPKPISCQYQEELIFYTEEAQPGGNIDLLKCSSCIANSAKPCPFQERENLIYGQT